jgi:hypothetical protein
VVNHIDGFKVVTTKVNIISTLKAYYAGIRDKGLNRCVVSQTGPHSTRIGLIHQPRQRYSRELSNDPNDSKLL